MRSFSWAFEFPGSMNDPALPGVIAVVTFQTSVIIDPWHIGPSLQIALFGSMIDCDTDYVNQQNKSSRETLRSSPVDVSI